MTGSSNSYFSWIGDHYLSTFRYSNVNDKYEYFYLFCMIEVFVPIEKLPLHYGKLSPNLVGLYEKREKMFLDFHCHFYQFRFFLFLGDRFDGFSNKYQKHVERKFLGSSSESKFYKKRIPSLKDEAVRSAMVELAKAPVLPKNFQR